jgi:16S rRNA processing protein RimM
LRGDVVIVPITNHVERFAVGSVLFDGDEALEIVATRQSGDRFVVRFFGVTDRTAAEIRRGHVLRADPLAADPDELFVHELIGIRLVDQHDRDLGRVRHVEANPAHDILVTDRDVLVPIVFLGAISDGVGRVEVPDGLIELYLED